MLISLMFSMSISDATVVPFYHIEFEKGGKTYKNIIIYCYLFLCDKL